MRNNHKFLSLLSVSILLLVGAGCAKPAEHASSDDSGTQSFAPMIDGEKATIGQDVNGMTLEDFNCTDDTDCSIDFSGEATITGQYHLYDSLDEAMNAGQTGVACMDNLSEESIAQLPMASMDSSFCFSNPDTARIQFDATEGAATVTINDYMISTAAGETSNEATLISVVQQ